MSGAKLFAIILVSFLGGFVLGIKVEDEVVFPQIREVAEARKEQTANVAQKAAIPDPSSAPVVPVVEENGFAEAYHRYVEAEQKGMARWSAMNDLLKTADEFERWTLTVYALNDMMKLGGRSAISQMITAEVAERFKSSARIRLASAANFDDAKSMLYIVQDMDELSPLFSDLLALIVEKMKQYAGASFENWSRVEDISPTEDVVKKMIELASTSRELLHACATVIEHKFVKYERDICRKAHDMRRAEALGMSRAK